MKSEGRKIKGRKAKSSLTMKKTRRRRRLS
jgi:hypothetical protein